MKIQGVSIPYYKRDNTGSVREWRYEVARENDAWAWRAVSGVKDGAMVESGWKAVEPKNVGRSNSTTSEEQALFEAEAEAKKKQDKGYFENIEKIDTFDKFKPMLAYDYAKVKSIEFPVIAQPKLDGIRCIARKDGLWTRAGKKLVAVPHVWEELKDYFDRFPGAVIDGELYNHDLKEDFNKLSSLIRKTKPTEADLKESATKVQYWVYDLYSEHKDGTFNRIKKLKEFHSGSDIVIPVFSPRVDNQEELDTWYGKWLELGYEGQMIRKMESMYETGKRSKNLLKRKEFLDKEFKVLRVEEGVGNWAGYIKRFVLELPDGREFGSNVRGNQATLKALLESGKTPDWATCRYFTPTPDGIPRFPVVTDWGKGERND